MKNPFGVKIGAAQWTLGRSTVVRRLFSPMIGYLFTVSFVKRKYVAGDETPISGTQEAGRRAQSKSYVWLFRSGDGRTLSPISFISIIRQETVMRGEVLCRIGTGAYINYDR